MSNDIFEKFNSMFDLEGLKHDVEEAASKSGDYVDVPKGDYEVAVTKIELGETGAKSKTPGMPMAKVWFKILAGEYKGQLIFMNQMLTNAFGIHKMNQLLDSLESGLVIHFENFTQYADLMRQVFTEIDGKGEYALSYGENDKGYSTYTIMQRFE